jgi:adenylosuccinate lyase
LNYDAISPMDGRYRSEAEPLASYFSERAFTAQRIRVELAYLGLLVDLHVAPNVRVPRLDPDMDEIKKLEDKLGHDVKAVEVFIRESLRRSPSRGLAPYVHLGLTSEDTNSLAFAVLLKGALADVLIPAYSSLALALARLSGQEARTPMLARTHGRPAVPTTFGKEMAVFAVRIAERTALLKRLVPMAKFSGAVGTYASFGLLARLDWSKKLAGFVGSFGVDAAAYSTQVVPGERLSDLLHVIINLNQLISSLSTDLWLYQTLDYVHFARRGKVSSSTMPQKENPVDIENAEGQADVSNSLLVLIAYRLQKTRMQRDLSDSVVRRMTGQGLSHSLVACRRVTESLRNLRVERQAMRLDLDRHPEVLAEREQILKRLAGDSLGYEKVKSALERGELRPPDVSSLEYLGSAPTLAKDCPRIVRSLLSLGPAPAPSVDV